jgi:alkylhydroperoxidase/carboxymuconolactone decarboxylase family protein YurZ
MTFLPSPYKRFVKTHPDLAKRYEDLAAACHDAGPLPEKTRRLIKLGIAIGESSEGAVKSHARQAFELGVSAEESISDNPDAVAVKNA